MEYLSLIITISVGVFTIAGTMIAMMLWVRAEACADRRDIVNLIIAIKDDARAFSEKMAAESKDFHSRLCAIEERRISQNKGK